MADNRKHGTPETGRTTEPVKAVKPWARIPDGTRVRHRLDGQEGIIEGLTAIVAGDGLNPDGMTQYRVNTGAPERRRVAEEDLLILSDRDGLVLMGKEHVEYRRYVTERLRTTFADDRFVSQEVSGAGGSLEVRPRRVVP
ncbi:hypothetical protein [Nitrospira sp. Kam-Ns4a]